MTYQYIDSYACPYECWNVESVQYDNSCVAEYRKEAIRARQAAARVPRWEVRMGAMSGGETGGPP